MNPFRYIEDKLNAFATYVLSGFAPDSPVRFVAREGLHFAGGALIGLVPVLTHSRLFSTLAGLLLTGIIIYKEIGEDNVSQHRYKTFIDCIAWVLGFLTPTLVYYFLLN